MSRRLLIAVSLLLVALSAFAQDATTGAQNPAPVNTFELDAGYAFAVDGNKDDDTFYRVVYLGKLLTKNGTPFKFAEGLDLAAPVLTQATGDRPELALRLVGGGAALGGTLIEADGAKPLKLRGLDRFDLRGTALVTAKSAGGPIQIAAGLETPPFRIPNASKRQYTNWLVFGANVLHREQTDTNADQNFALATYRAFLGKAFGWHKSADVGETAKKLEKILLEQAPTLAKAKEVVAKIEKIGANERTTIQALLVDAVGDTDNEAKWAAQINAFALGTAEAVTDQQTFAFYAESTGWFAFDGDDEGEFKNLLTVALDYWPLVASDDVFLRLRYENGYQRALPDAKLNQILLSATLRF
jgi:hypothetical protein